MVLVTDAAFIKKLMVLAPKTVTEGLGMDHSSIVDSPMMIVKLWKALESKKNTQMFKILRMSKPAKELGIHNYREDAKLQLQGNSNRNPFSSIINLISLSVSTLINEFEGVESSISKSASVNQSITEQSEVVAYFKALNSPKNENLIAVSMNAEDKLAYMENLVNDRLLQGRNSITTESMTLSPSTSKPSPETVERKTKREGLNVSGSVQPYHPRLKNFWYHVAFSRDLKEDTLMPIDCFEEPWVLFRGKDGKPGCIRNTCAHRACPLDLGTVNEGRVMSLPWVGVLYRWDM